MVSIMKQCIIDKCEKLATKKNMCNKHYLRNYRHGSPHRTLNERHGMRNTSEYHIWCAMLTRCYNINSKAYKNYGSRGILVCLRWKKSFINFSNDMGNKPTGYWLERIDNNGNYEKNNCLWTTPKKNSWNRRSTKMSFAKAEEVRELYKTGLSQYKIADMFRVSQSTIWQILKNNYWVDLDKTIRA